MPGLLTPRRRKAPVALLAFRSVLIAVFVAALLISLAASSSPFVTTAAASEALKNRLAELTPFATGVQIQGGTSLFHQSANSLAKEDAARARAVRGLAARLPGVGDPVLTVISGIEYTLPGDTPVALMSRTGAVDHVKRLSSVRGAGVWISSIVATTEHLKAGDMLRFDPGTSGHRPVSVRIKGIYRALSSSPQVSYWINLTEQIYPQDPNDAPPPSFVLTSNAELYRLLLAIAGPGGVKAGEGQLENLVELPVYPHGMTLARARRLEAGFDLLGGELRGTSLGRTLGCVEVGPRGCTFVTSLSSAVILANQNAAAVTVPISLLADAGTAIALAVAAASGVFLVRRRRAEVALAYARGAHVLGFAGRTAVEAFLPALAGGAAGLGLTFGLTGVFAPAGSTDPATVGSGIAHAAVAVAIGLLLLVAAACIAFLRLYETGARRIGWLRFAPWELPLLAVALYLFQRITSGGGLSGDAAAGTAHPSLAVFVFPLLLVAAVAGLVARVARVALRRSSAGLRGSAGVPVYLAVRRLAAARGLLVLLAVVTAVSIGAFSYAEALATSLAHTTVEKAYMATGSDAQAEIQQGEPLPSRFPYPITRVEFSNQSASIDTPDGTQADVMLIEPGSIESTLHWEADWGTNPAGLIRKLAASPSSPLPVIVTSDSGKMRALSIQGDRFPVRVLGTVSAFPEMSPGIPLVITSYRALAAATSRVKLYDALGVTQTYVWGKGPPQAVEQALASSRMGVFYPQSTETFLSDPSVVLVTRTFSFMRTIAIAAAVLVLLGLLLYLQARQKSQVIASALARRMGLPARAEALSISLEVAAILAFGALVGGGLAVAVAGPVVRHLDPLPQNAPAPIFVLPTLPLLVAAACLAAVAIVAGVATSWLAGRADVSEELRVA